MSDVKKATIVLATANQGKVRELADPMAAFGLEVVGLSAFPQIGEIEENGSTFEENALIKATTVARLTGLVAVADDSGLEVDALGGAPGIHSARYSDDMSFLDGETKDQRNIRKLLGTLGDLPPEKRGCRFVSAMAASTPEGRTLVLRGTWEGVLLSAPKGSNGFGYDPIFFDRKLGKTAAELERDAKNAVSHRGKALRMLLEKWPGFWGC